MTPNRRFAVSTLSVVGVLFAQATIACSGNGTNGSDFGAGASSGAGSPGSGGAMSGGTLSGGALSGGALSGGALSGGNGGGLGVGSAGQGSGGGMACAAAPYQATQLPLDMFIMLDQSKSMDDATAAGPTKWSAVTSAIQGFVNQSGLSDVEVGLQYFGFPIPGGTGGKPKDSCKASDYSTPEVQIAPLPGVGAAIIMSLGMHKPSTSTPTSAALQGAIDYSTTWATKNPDHVVVAVLATDGEPTECDTSDADIAAIAATGLAGKPSVKTFTIGVFAPADIPSGPNTLDAISTAGGTTKSFVINTSDASMDVETQFLAALNAIRGSALGCQYSIPTPEAGTPDYNKLNVQYTPGGTKTGEGLLQYANKASCPATGDGWYYDNDTAPTQILLCATTCTKVSADKTGSIDVLIGCKTNVGPLK